ncbi:MAG: alpha/beta hydrolase [Acidobacteriota bacterium]|nr:alpha/beta hydrolase [Acidobacteriota bacterium]
MSKVNIGERALRILKSILLGYLLVLLLVRVFESRLIFFPDYPGRMSGDWKPRNLPLREVWLTSADGTKLHAWWIPNEKARFTFLAFHGNAGNIADRATIYEFLGAVPANVFALEYRGYGRSGGKPSEAGFYADAEAAYEYLTNTQNLDPKSIVSYGQSLGTAVAAQLAARHEVGAVVLEAPFLSAAKIVTHVFRFLPGLQLLVYSQFDTHTQLKKINAPIFVVHCRQDPVLPFALGQEVYAASKPPKTFLEIDGYCHEEASVIAPDKYRVALHNFLNGVYIQTK